MSGLKERHGKCQLLTQLYLVEHLKSFWNIIALINRGFCDVHHHWHEFFKVNSSIFVLRERFEIKKMDSPPDIKWIGLVIFFLYFEPFPYQRFLSLPSSLVRKDWSREFSLSIIRLQSVLLCNLIKLNYTFPSSSNVISPLSSASNISKASFKSILSKWYFFPASAILP